MSELSYRNQERLRLWRENPPTAKSKEWKKEVSQPSFISRSKDYGDDILDFENKQILQWNKERAFQERMYGK